MDRGRGTGVGASLLSGPYRGNMYLVSVERADSVYTFDADAFTFRAAYPVGARPFPGAATSDFRKAFVPGLDDGTVTIIDLYGDRVLETIQVGTMPTGGVVLPGDEEYAVVVRGDDVIRIINTASHQIVRDVREGVGDSPFSITISPTGRLAFVNNTASHTVSVFEVQDWQLVGTINTPELPIVMAVHPSGASLWVSTEEEDFLTVYEIPDDDRGFRDNPADRPDPTGPITQVAVMGIIHGTHRTSRLWGIPRSCRPSRHFAPDVICTEIAPDRWKWIEEGLEGNRVTDPRVQRFPEYVDDGAILPRMDELGYQVEPCAGWSQEMSDSRGVVIADFNSDAERKAEYDARVEAAVAALGTPSLPADDPRYIHSAEYDAGQKAGLAIYDQVQNDLIGPGGWTNINVAHYREIDRVIKAHHGERILITFGGGHKYWILEQLRRRDDVEILELGPYLPGR